MTKKNSRASKAKSPKKKAAPQVDQAELVYAALCHIEELRKIAEKVTCLDPVFANKVREQGSLRLQVLPKLKCSPPVNRCYVPCLRKGDPVHHFFACVDAISSLSGGQVGTSHLLCWKRREHGVVKLATSSKKSSGIGH